MAPGNVRAGARERIVPSCNNCLSANLPFCLGDRRFDVATEVRIDPDSELFGMLEVFHRVLGLIQHEVRRG